MSQFKTLLICLFMSSLSIAHEGLITLKSQHNVKTTSEKLLTALKSKGMTVFDVIDHQKGAKKADKELRPTTLVIFGNPKVGTPLMQCDQHVAIDLPQKALIWQDEAGHVWYTYNDPMYLLKRHSLHDCKKIIDKVTVALANFAKKATQ